MSSLLLLLSIYPRYLIESVAYEIEIGKELICSDGRVSLYNFEVDAIRSDFKALKATCDILHYIQ